MTATDGYDAHRWRDFEHAGWQTVAQHYHAWLGGITSSAISQLLDAVDLKPGTRLLDIASGPGYGAAMATERGALDCTATSGEHSQVATALLRPARS